MTDCRHPEKTSFTSESSARRALHCITDPHGGRMKPYRCGNHFHLGHGNDARINRLINSRARHRKNRKTR